MTATSARTYLSNLPTVTQLSGLETVGNFLRSFLLSLPGRDPNKYIWEKMFWWSPDILVSKLGWEDREPLRWQISAEVFIMWSVDCISPYIIQTWYQDKDIHCIGIVYFHLKQTCSVYSFESLNHLFSDLISQWLNLFDVLVVFQYEGKTIIKYYILRIINKQQIKYVKWSFYKLFYFMHYNIKETNLFIYIKRIRNIAQSFSFYVNVLS